MANEYTPRRRKIRGRITRDPYRLARTDETINDVARQVQADRDGTDINLILGRYRGGNFAPNVNLQRPVYGDFSEAEDYLTALSSVKRAQELFDTLPARVRAYCENNPANLIPLVNDPENDELLRTLGITNPIVDRGEEPSPEGVAEPPSGDSPEGSSGE